MKIIYFDFDFNHELNIWEDMAIPIPIPIYSDLDSVHRHTLKENIELYNLKVFCSWISIFRIKQIS